VNPTHAIAVDVSYAHTPDAPREKCGLIGKGPMIGVAPVLCRDMSDRLIKLAGERGIPFQIEAMGGKTGTNADQIATARRGVRTALVSVPQKYMHTPAEVVDPGDVEHTGRLLAAMIREIAGRDN
jgi:endoglucanase